MSLIRNRMNLFEHGGGFLYSFALFGGELAGTCGCRRMASNNYNQSCDPGTASFISSKSRLEPSKKATIDLLTAEPAAFILQFRPHK